MKNIIKKINLLRLTALFVAGGIGLAFNAPQTNLAMVTHGVLSEDNDRYEITPNIAEQHDCGQTEIACTVEFDSDSNVPYLEAGSWYLDKEPGILEANKGPYIPKP